LPQLRQDILDPDANGAANYLPITVRLRGGKTVKGVARNRTNYSLQIQDAQGNLHLLSTADVEEMTVGRGSPMPKDFGKRLTAAELENILAYLSRQSARPVELSKK
jgi:putative heme-binding domain-containing protein